MVINREQMKSVVNKIGDLKSILSEKDYYILTEWLSGRTYESIAAEFRVSVSTIKIKINGKNYFGKGSLYKKLVVRTRKKRKKRIA